MEGRDSSEEKTLFAPTVDSLMEGRRHPSTLLPYQPLQPVIANISPVNTIRSLSSLSSLSSVNSGASDCSFADFSPEVSADSTPLKLVRTIQDNSRAISQSTSVRVPATCWEPPADRNNFQLHITDRTSITAIARLYTHYYHTTIKSRSRYDDAATIYTFAQ